MDYVLHALRCLRMQGLGQISGFYLWLKFTFYFGYFRVIRATFSLFAQQLHISIQPRRTSGLKGSLINASNPFRISLSFMALYFLPATAPLVWLSAHLTVSNDLISQYALHLDYSRCFYCLKGRNSLESERQ